MQYARVKEQPPIPQNHEQAVTLIPLSQYANLNNEPFYRGGINLNNHCCALLFASNEQLQLLQHTNNYCMDATFKVVPRLYYQLFVLFAIIGSHVFPVLYALMSRKTTELYAAVFQKLREIAPAFRPARVMADFETAPATALRTTFPDLDIYISGCWFHYCQAVIRVLKRSGYTQQYAIDGVNRAIRMLLVVPLLPADKITDGLTSIAGSVANDPIIFPIIHRISEHVRTAYIEKAGIGAARLSVHGQRKLHICEILSS